MTIPQGIKNVYRKPKKGNNYRRKKGGGSSTKKSSSSKRRSDSDSYMYSSKSKKSRSKSTSKKTKETKSTSDSESKRRKKSRRSSSSTRKSRSPRKKKISLFKRKSRSKDSSKSKKKSKDTHRSGGSRHKKSEDMSKKQKKKKDKSKDSKSENKQCNTKEEVSCRDACISDSCGFHGDKMCVRRCKQECCTSNRSSDDESTTIPTPTPTEAPVTEGGPAPQPTTLQPVVPVTPPPTPAVVGLSCPSDTTTLDVPGSLGCSEGGCCIIDTTSVEACNYAAFEAAGDSTTQEGKVLVTNIDTSADGPFQIGEDCPVACTSQCRLSQGTLSPESTPPPTNTFFGPGTISCASTDDTEGGYCETTMPETCNTDDLAESGDLITTDDGKTVVSNINTAEPVTIESGCLIDCSEECTFGRASF